MNCHHEPPGVEASYALSTAVASIVVGDKGSSGGRDGQIIKSGNYSSGPCITDCLGALPFRSPRRQRRPRPLDRLLFPVPLGRPRTIGFGALRRAQSAPASRAEPCWASPSPAVLSTWREVGAAGPDIAITSAQVSLPRQHRSHRARNRMHHRGRLGTHWRTDDGGGVGSGFGSERELRETAGPAGRI